MSLRELPELIAELQRLVGASDPATASDDSDFFDEFENLVAQVAVIDDPMSIEALLGLLPDDFDDDLWFMIVHTVERFDNATYVAHLLNALPRIVATAPRWANMLLVRVLNEPNCRKLLATTGHKLDPAQTDALRTALTDLADDEPEFTARCNAVINVLPNA